MATTTPPAITALPSAPDPNNRATFNTLAYPWSAALPTFRTELSAVAVNVKANADEAVAAAVTAVAKELLTDADAIATAADRVQTGLDVIASAASAASAAAIAGAFVGTSASSLLIATGSKAFTTQAGEQYTTGIWMTAVSAANSANWMFGQVTSYSGTDLVLDVQAVGGSGTYADWNLSLTGARGAPGPAGTLGGTASSTIELLTGANIASDATVNLDTATGNRVHITGTTTITAVTLTRGPRTVIFDGILTLTHHATNNNLPGAANITTAAGDRAIYESDGTTVYCLSYIKVSGGAIVGSGVGDHEIVVNTGNGHGSTNTKIRRYTTTVRSTGTAITYADSSTLGASFTINENGLYAIASVDSYGTSGYELGASVNSAQLTTNLRSITASNRLIFVAGSGGALSACGLVKLLAGDVVRPHTDGLPDSTFDAYSTFSIRKVGNV